MRRCWSVTPKDEYKFVPCRSANRTVSKGSPSGFRGDADRSAGRGRKSDHSGPPARVLHLWFTDPRFLDVERAPVDLPFEGDFPSFSDLVKAAGGDVPPGAVRAELLRAAAVTEMPNGSWRPTKRYFVPGDFDEKTVTILSGILFPMISGVAHNSDPNRSGPGFIQRFAFARLGDEDAASFRQWSRDQSRNFIESIDDWLKSKSLSWSRQMAVSQSTALGSFTTRDPRLTVCQSQRHEKGGVPRHAPSQSFAVSYLTKIVSAKTVPLRSG